MLSELRIRGLGVIDDAVLDLAPGLNVLTGETGAGKTMVVTGLGLLLGARADAGLVRPGVRQAVVEGIADLPAGHAALSRAAAAGVDPADTADGLVLARTLSAEGRSRAHVGGRAAPVSTLSDVGEVSVAVHGQADQWRLRRPEQHRLLLDRYGGPPVAEAFSAYRVTYQRVEGLRAELDRVRALDRDRAVESEVLRSGLEDLERVDPQPGEDAELRAEEERLAHADGLRIAAGAAYDALAGPDDPGGRPIGVSQALADARAVLGQAAGHDPQLAALEQRTAELGYLAADLAADLSGYLAGVDVDPGRLAWVSQRRAELARLTRSYGGESSTDVLAWGQRAAARLADLDGAYDRATHLAAELEQARDELNDRAERLSARRREAAGRLGAAVTVELSQLAMGRAVLEVAVEPRAAVGPAGQDDVEIRLAANPGVPARSVARAASGGELSRVMLALEVVCAAASAEEDVATFVFDEVDAGVGGRAAVDVGARLAELARHAQVVVVTHLAQVAAYADRHLVIHKSSDGHITASGVDVVDGADRERELARMMSGTSDSRIALEHARELLRSAQAGRADLTCGSEAAANS